MEDFKKHIESLTEFSAESWALLLPCLTVLEVKKGACFLTAGEQCKAVYYIDRGYAKAAQFNEQGKQVNTAFYFEKDFATELTSLTTASAANFNLIACEQLRLIRLDRNQLLESYHQSHQIASFGRKVLELLSVKQQQELNAFKILSPTQRYQKLLAAQPEMIQRISLTQLASYLGVSRETLSRIRAK